MGFIKSAVDLLALAQDSSRLALRLLLDTNIVLSYVDQKDHFHKYILGLLTNLLAYQTEFYFVLPTRLELTQKWRLKVFSDYLYRYLSMNNEIFSSFEIDRPKIFKKILEGKRLDEQQIKIIRDWCLAKPEGLNVWHEFTQDALSGEFNRLENALENMDISYVSYDHAIYTAPKGSRPQWQSAYTLMEKYGLSSNDAAILNMCSTANGLDGIVTSDRDFCSAIEAGAIPGLTCFFVNA